MSVFEEKDRLRVRNLFSDIIDSVPEETKLFVHYQMEIAVRLKYAMELRFIDAKRLISGFRVQVPGGAPRDTKEIRLNP